MRIPSRAVLVACAAFAAALALIVPTRAPSQLWAVGPSGAPPTATPTPLPTPTLPPQGLFNSCEIDTAIATCESDDSTMTTAGFTLEVNYIGLMAHKTGAGSLDALLAYDHTIGMRQLINVKDAIKDANPLTGTSLVTINGDSNFANDCGAVNNQQVIDCAATVVAAHPDDVFAWYIYDEPGCPNQGIGYCQGSQAGKNYQAISLLAAYIATKDSHPIVGIQTPSGVPPASGGWAGSGAQPQIDNLYSCNGQAPCNGNYPWITDVGTPNTGFDYYPVANPAGGQTIEDIAFLPFLLQHTFAANYASEKDAYVGQTFSWLQEGGSGCHTISDCPYPTQAQEQEMRDQALYYANGVGNPLYMVLWYQWADVQCNGNIGDPGSHNYTGCDPVANLAHLSAAAAAPFPVSPPTPVSSSTPGVITHVVIIVQENRTVDNMFNGWSSAGGNADTVSVDPVSGNPLHVIHMTDPCGISHSHNNFAFEYDNGNMGQWHNVSCNGYAVNGALAYVNPSDTTHYWTLASRYGFGNHMLQDNEGPSFPAHQYLFRGQSGGIASTGGIDLSQPWAISENSSVQGNGTSCKGHGTGPGGLPLTNDLDLRSAYPGNGGSVLTTCIATNNIFAEADSHSVSWRYYSDKDTGLWSGPMADPNLYTRSEIINCSPQAMIDMLALKPHGNVVLPALTYINPDGKWSDHPGDPDTNTDGEDWVANLVNAIGQSQYWNSTAILITWDDWGGWFDHYQPGGTPGQGLRNCPFGLAGYTTPYSCGFRVPLIIVSPFAKGGYVVTTPGPIFGTMLRFVQGTFGLGEGSLHASDTYATEDLSEAFDFTQAPTPFQTLAPIITPTSRYTTSKCGTGPE